MKRVEIAASLLVVLVGACIEPAANRAPPRAASRPRRDRPVDDPSETNAMPPVPARATACPAPAGSDSHSEFADLTILSRTLFYIRGYHPRDLSPRARELVVAALEAVASQESEIVVERDQAARPRWVTVTVRGQECTLNLERVDAPWSLRTTLQQAALFIQGHLVAASSADSRKRLMKLEIAATNGMLTAFDRQSHLLDQETYRAFRAQLPKRSASAKTEAVAAAGPPVAPPAPRLAPGKVAYLQLRAFGPGTSAELERVLAALAGGSPKGFVIDLRDNTGGLLDEAVRFADAFIKAGTLGSIASKQERRDLVAHDDGHEPAGPIVVLVNKQTASASEVVAAAIKNLGRGIILGEPTAGSAALQFPFDLPPGRRREPPRNKDRDVVQDILDDKKPAPAVEETREEPLGLVLTAARLLAAGGAEIDGAGVQPDVLLSGLVLDPSRSDDCLRQLAESVIAQAPDPRRATLLATAKALAPQAGCWPAVPSAP